MAGFLRPASDSSVAVKEKENDLVQHAGRLKYFFWLRVERVCELEDLRNICHFHLFLHVFHAGPGQTGKRTDVFRAHIRG